MGDDPLEPVVAAPYVAFMEPERTEVYERIPWETLEKRGNDRQWMVYAVAGAVTLGALAYSFTRNQPLPSASADAPVATTVPAATVTSNMGSTPSTMTSPIVVAEADLYAVDPERLIDQAGSHAEWFAVEYVSIDGSEESRETLSSLLPSGVPLPVSTEGVQVFVDWAGTQAVTQTGPLSFDVEVLVRSLSSAEETGFVRQAPLLVGVEVEIGEDGLARVVAAPTVRPAPTGEPAAVSLVELPPEVAALIEGQGEIVGGLQLADGSWEVVVMAEGGDGVRRPVTLRP